MSNRVLLLSIIGMLLLASPEPSFFAQPSPRKVSYITYAEARPIIEALRDVLPADLSAADRRICRRFGRIGLFAATRQFVHGWFRVTRTRW